MEKFESSPLRVMGFTEQTARWLAEGVIQYVRDYAIFLLSTDGRVATWNAGAQRIKGYRAEEIIGQHFSRFYPAEAIERGHPDRELEIAEAEGRFEEEGWRVRKGGSRFWANVIITAVRDEANQLRGFLKITRDLTDRRRQEEEIRQSEERFRLLVDGVRDYAIVLLDEGGRIISWNAGAERITGHARNEILGELFSDLVPDPKVGEQHLEIARELGRFEEEGWRLRKDGSEFWASVVITSLLRSDGSLRGYAAVTRDLSDRKRVEALEAESREMYEFLAMLAHELRNPLAPVQNAIEVLRSSAPGDPDHHWSKQVIERQVAHLSRLVEDLLDVSRITTGKISLRMEPVELRSVLVGAVEASRSQFDARRQRLDLIAGGPEWVQGDETRLLQIVLNLLNNAAKYTPDEGRVEVELRREQDQAVIEVRDNGIGMTPELVGRAFNLFEQGDRTLARSEGGLGIGLTLVRHLVHLHGGEVRGSSGGPGLGSKFTMRLPRLKNAPAEAKPRARAAERNGFGRVLVVDDNRDSADTMAKLLEIWGHPVQIAYDGEEAMDGVEAWRPEFVLLDLGLPKMDGFEVARRIRRVPGLERSRIFAMSGYGQESDKERTRGAGFDEHLVKPVDITLLRQLLADRPAPEVPRP